MRKYTVLSVVLFTVFAVISCEKQQTEPTFFRVSETSVSLPVDGGSRDVGVSCDFSWSASPKSGSWLKSSSTVLEGDAGTITITAGFNDSAESRSDTVIVKSGSSVSRIAVTQAGMNSLLSQTAVTIADKGKVAFVLEALDDWTAEPVLTKSSASWFEISPSSGKKGSQLISVLPLEQNLNIGDRTGYAKITMGGRNLYVTVTQKQTDAILLSSDKVEISNKESSFEVEVRTNVNCTASIGDECRDWLSVESTRALDSRTVVFHALANTSESVRKGTVVFSGNGVSETVEVWQAETDILVLDGSRIDIGPEGGAAGVDVRTNVEYSVELLDNPDWIRLVTTRSQRVDRIDFVIDPNSGYSSRTATLRVKDLNSSLSQDLVVVQGQKDAILMDSEDITVSNKGESFSVSLESNVDYGIRIFAEGDWLRVLQTRGLSSHEEVFVADANPSIEPRDAEIVFYCGQLSDTILVHQGGKDFIHLSKNGADLDFFGGKVNVSVSSNVEYRLARVDADDWIEEIKPEVSVDGVHDFLVHPNKSPEMRRGYLVFRDVSSELADSLLVLQLARPQNTFLDYDAPGAYNFAGADWVYSSGSSQKWIMRGASSYSFRIVWPSEPSFLEISGLEYGSPELGEWVDISVGVFSPAGTSSKDCKARVIQKENGICWLKSDGSGSFIVKEVSK